MLVFEKTIIKKFWPADDKGEEDEIVRQIVVQTEARVDNSLQISELYNNMVRGLVRVVFLDNVSGDSINLAAVTIKPFNIKQKKVKIGKGDQTDYVKEEYAAITMVCRMEDDSGKMLADLYPFFNFELQMQVEEFRLSMGDSQSEDETEISL